VIVEEYGEPSDTDPFWKSLSANNYLQDISGPVQIHHGTADASVPVEFSQNLEKQLQNAGKEVEYYEYSGDDHDITANFNIAIQRSVEYFDRYVKQSQN
jgi:dipeptidyl aminopeptidase/acylaminoacyl peptidase